MPTDTAKTEAKYGTLFTAAEAIALFRIDHVGFNQLVANTPADETKGKQRQWTLRTLIPLFRDHWKPREATPRGRRDDIEAIRALNKMQLEAGRLVPVEAYREELARVAKTCVQALTVLRDQVEREAGLNPEQGAAIDRAVRKARDEISDRLTA